MSDDSRATVSGIVERLLATTMPGQAVSLDTVGDVVGSLPVTYEQIGAIIDALEGAGRTIAQAEIDVADALRRVLSAAREARAAGSATPSVQQLQQATGLDRTTVLASLRFADTLKR